MGKVKDVTQETKIVEKEAVTDQITIEPTPPVHLVVCAYSGTEDLLRQIWQKHCPATEILVMPVAENYSVREAIEECLATAAVAEQFVFVPANAFPCAPVNFAELCVPVVYVNKAGHEQYDHRLPILFDKTNLVEYLAASNDEGETFIRSYMQRYATRPVQVGFSFGNYVMPVLRGNPCENVVLEGLLRRKFITASPTGFAAISGLVTQTLLK